MDPKTFYIYSETFEIKKTEILFIIKKRKE